jgi:hypothetical protein
VSATPLYLVGTPSPRQRTLFKTAKARLGITEPLQFTAAYPGCGRVIAFGEWPGFFCDFAMVTTEFPEVVTEVLAWYMGKPDRRAKTGADWLSEICHGPVTEVAQEATVGVE